MTRFRTVVFLVAAVMVTAALVGGTPGPRPSSAQDSGGELTFNTPTPANSGPSDDGDDAGDVADRVSFGADAWAGGFLRNDSAYYGRPWASIYGRESDYSAASLTLTLSNDPDEPIVLTFDGLDDEEPGNNQIAVEINGRRIYQGESWFPSWDGAGNGTDAAWTAVRITIPPGSSSPATIS